MKIKTDDNDEQKTLKIVEWKAFFKLLKQKVNGKEDKKAKKLFF